MIQNTDLGFRECMPSKNKDLTKLLSQLPKFTIQDFHIVKKIGQGKFSEVFLAINKATNFLVALKILEKSYISENQLELQLKREILIHLHCTHPNIIQLYGMFHDASKIYLILEYALEGDLYNILKSQPNRYFCEKAAAHFVRDVCSALVMVHSKGFIHRDLKPENLFVSFGVVKLGDFGLATFDTNQNQIEQKNGPKRETFCGTLDYISPEMFQRSGHDSRVDVWSVGVLCYELCCGFPPFEAITTQEIQQRACTVDLQIPDHFTKPLKKLLNQILVVNPEERITLQQVLASEWVALNCSETN